MCSRTLLAAACAFESGHLTLMSGAGEGEVVSKEVGKEEIGEEERGARGGVVRESRPKPRPNPREPKPKPIPQIELILSQTQTEPA